MEMEESSSSCIDKNCVLCGKTAHFTSKAEEYTIALITNLVSPFDRARFMKEDQLYCFEFCSDCGVVLEELLQIKKALEYILENIKSKVTEIKFSILKNYNLGCDNLGNEIKEFRKLATKDMRPVVRMNEKNVLAEKIKGSSNLRGNGRSSSRGSVSNDISFEVIKMESTDYDCFEDEGEAVTRCEQWEEQPMDYQYQESNFVGMDTSTVASSSGNGNQSYDYSEYSDEILPNLTASPQKENFFSQTKLRWSHLVIIAIAQSESMCTTLEELQDFVLENFPICKSYDSWKKSLLRSLTISSFFKKSIINDCQVTSTGFEIWTIGELDLQIVVAIKDILNVLKQDEILQAMAFPERRCRFIAKLLALRNKVQTSSQTLQEYVLTIPEPSSSQRSLLTASQDEDSLLVENNWQRPPLPLAQLIFIALSNCTERRATTENLVECLRKVFPFFMENNPVNTWKIWLDTTLLINKCFAMAKVNNSNDSQNELLWIINEEEADSMRSKIKQTLESSEVKPSSYIDRSEAVLKNVLRPSSDCSLSNKTSTNSNLSTKCPTLLEQLLAKNPEPLHSPENINVTISHAEPNAKEWQRPPLNFAQLIFVALSNCPDKQATIFKLKDKIRDIFPFAAATQTKWENMLTTVLFYNKKFIRTNAGEKDKPSLSDVWTLNNYTAEYMRDEIRKALTTSSLPKIDYMKTPDETLKNALISEAKDVSDDEVQIIDDLPQVPKNNTQWCRPPFNFPQVIFMALSSCPGRQANLLQIVESIRNIFPIFRKEDLAKTWESGCVIILHKVLLGDHNFVRANMASEIDLPSTHHTWTINEEAAIQSIIMEIRNIVRISGIDAIRACMNLPEETLRKALIVDKHFPMTAIKNGEWEKTLNGQAPLLNVTTDTTDKDIKIEEEFTRAPSYTSPVVIMEEEDENKIWNRPPFSFFQLTVFVLASNGNNAMTGYAICGSIMKYFPYFRNCKPLLCEHILNVLCGSTCSYFLQDANEGKDLSLLSLLNTQNTEMIKLLRLEMYSVFKQFYVDAYQTFSKPSMLFPMLKNVFGNEFEDYSFLQNITVYRQVK